MVRMPCLDSLGVDNGVAETSASITLSIKDLPDLHWLLLKEEQIILSVAKKRRVEVSNEEPVVTKWDSLPSDLQDNIFQRLEFKDLFRCKTLSTAWKEHIESDAFCKWRGATSSGEGSFTALSYYIKNKAWQCSGYDLHSRMWRSLPTFSYLPAPDAELFKEYSVCGHGNLMCAEVSKLPEKGELVVFNPLTGKKRALPPLPFPRTPVLVHILVNSAAKSYKVVVAGSSTANDEHLSKKVEVFDSNTSKWTEACELPGPVFGLNEHQAGVCVNGVLHFIAFLEGSKGVVAFDVENGTWLENMACAIPFSFHSNTLQLVENNGKVYLFSEQERGGSVEHCIDVLEFSNLDKRAGACHLRNVVRVKKSGGRGLQVYPEHTCVSFGDGKLCVFNTLTRDGLVYDMQDGKQVEVLPPPPPDQKGDNFFSLNPASFTLQPNFDSDPLPPTVDAI
jgi:F-box interacting protein